MEPPTKPKLPTPAGDTLTFANTYTTPDTVPATIPANPNVPQTGDNSNIPLWFTAMLLSSLGLCICLIIKKKKGKTKD